MKRDVIVRKLKSVKVDITDVIVHNKPITKSKLRTIQYTQVNNMIRTGAKAQDVVSFIERSNKVKRTLNNKKLTKVSLSRTRDIFNIGKTNLDTPRKILEISKAPISVLSKHIRPEGYDEKTIRRLQRSGLLSKSSLRLIRQRQQEQKPKYIPQNEKLTEIIEIINSISRVDVYWDDIKRLCYDYLGIVVDKKEDLQKLGIQR